MSECRIGNTKVNKLMIGYMPPDPEQYKFDFTKWKLNPSYADGVEVFSNKIIVKRIIPQAYILVSQETDKTVSHINEIMQDTAFTITGIEQLVSDGTLTPYKHKTWGGPDCTGQGFVFDPANPWNASYSIDWPWQLGAEWQNSVYGIRKDGYTKIHFTNNFSGVAYNEYQIGMFLFTGTAVPEGQSHIDISDRPLTIELFPKYQYNGEERTEVWNMYNESDNNIYRKDKTIDNCWKEYGYLYNCEYNTNSIIWESLTQVSKDAVLTGNENVKCNKTDVKLPVPVDYESNSHLFKFIDCKLYNTDFWEIFRQKFNNYNFTESNRCILIGYNRITNIDGSLTVNIGADNVSLCNLFGNTNITSVHINTNSHPIEIYSLFKDCKNLIEVTSDVPIEISVKSENQHVNFAGVFANCNKITKLPEIAYNFKLYRIEYLLEYCQEITEVPQYGTNRTSIENTMRIQADCRQAFNGCNSLKKIGPVLDMYEVVPIVDNIYWLFMNCNSLEDVRIKNLGKGNWNLVSIGLSNTLNQESVDYLIDNIWNYAGGSEHYTLTVPSGWKDRISSERKEQVAAKGWTLAYA